MACSFWARSPMSKTTQTPLPVVPMLLVILFDVAAVATPVKTFNWTWKKRKASNLQYFCTYLPHLKIAELQRCLRIKYTHPSTDSFSTIFLFCFTVAWQWFSAEKRLAVTVATTVIHSHDTFQSAKHTMSHVWLHTIVKVRYRDKNVPRHLKATPEGKLCSTLIPGDRKCSTTGEGEKEWGRQREFGGIQSQGGML